MAVLARARRFERRVQGEQLRLAGDFLNQNEKCLDLVGRGRKRVDSFGAFERIRRKLLERAGSALEAYSVVAGELTQSLIALQSFFGCFSESRGDFDQT